MARTVQLSEEAYRTLAALKEKGESFSDVVMRVIRERKDPLALLELGPMDPDFDLEELRARSRTADLEKMRGWYKAKAATRPRGKARI